MLGDTAGGNAQKLDSITRGFTKAMLKGKVNMESLNMIAEAGVPIHTELARSMGYGKDQMTAFFKKISTGTVGTEELVKVFQKMTSQGGLFFGGMIRSSKTFDGVMSNMNDAVNLTFAAIGQEMLPVLKELALSVTGTMTSILKWVQANKELIGSSFKTFVSVISFVAKTIWFLRYVILAAAAGYTVFKIAVAMLTAAQWLLNIAMNANPIGAVILGIVALIAAGVLLYKNWDAVKTFFINFWNKWQGLITLAMFPLWPFIQAGKLLIQYWQPVKDFFVSLWDGILYGINAIMPYIEKLMGAVNYIGNLFGAGIGILGQGVNAAEQGARTVTAGVIPGATRSPNNSGAVNNNTTNTTNGTIGMTVDSGNLFSSIVQKGTFPKGFTLDHGTAK
jgi:tape measure domain-containing protein